MWENLHWWFQQMLATHWPTRESPSHTGGVGVNLENFPLWFPVELSGEDIFHESRWPVNGLAWRRRECECVSCCSQSLTLNFSLMLKTHTHTYTHTMFADESFKNPSDFPLHGPTYANALKKKEREGGTFGETVFSLISLWSSFWSL